MRLSKIIMACAASILSVSAFAADVTGVWQTEQYKGITGGGGKGKYDQVRIHACEDNPENICGTIVKSFLNDGSENTEDSFVGAPMLKDLKPKMVKDKKTKEKMVKENAFSKGEIWHPHMDKYFKSSIELDEQDPNILHLNGCIAFFCMGQDWTRVE